MRASSTAGKTFNPAAGYLPAAELVLTCALWGGVFTVARVSVRDAHPLIVAFFRFAVASCVLAAVLSTRRRLTVSGLVAGIAPGLAGVVSYNLFMFYGLKYAPAADGAMISPTFNPVATVMLAALFLKEPLTNRKVLGLALAICGQMLVFSEAFMGAEVGSSRLLGDVLLLLSALSWSAFALLGKRAMASLSPLELTTYACISGTIVLGVIAIPWARTACSALSQTGFWLETLYMAIFGTVAAFFLWHRGVAQMGTSRASFFIYLVPAFALVFAAAFLHEAPTVVQLVGMLIVLCAVVISTRT